MLYYGVGGHKSYVMGCRDSANHVMGWDSANHVMGWESCYGVGIMLCGGTVQICANPRMCRHGLSRSVTQSRCCRINLPQK